MLTARPAGLPLDTDSVLSKTPGRALAKTRNVLQENAGRNAPMTVIGKGKKALQNTPLQFKTLQSDRVSKDPLGKQIGPSKSKDVRPLGDKTPFPNRTANHPSATGEKTLKPVFNDGSLRPSSVRKHDRLPRSASKGFETPVTNGKHWDVSDIEIEVDVPVANQSIEEETFDEIEYMPPKPEDIPYEPPFEMPNYREIGKTLMSLIRSYTLEDDPPSADLTFTVDPTETNFFEPPTLPQREINDSPIARPKPASEAKRLTNPKQKSVVTNKITTHPVSQRPTQGTRTTAPANSRALPTVRRPPTQTSSARPPIAAARKSVSQPVSRAPTSQSTLHAPPSRASTRASSVARSTPAVRAGVAQVSHATSVARPPIKPAARPAGPAKGKPGAAAPSATSAVKNPSAPAPAPTSTSTSTVRPRSGTITKAAFESNTHVVVHIRNNSLEDVKRDLEGLVVFEDAFDDDDDAGFRLDL